MNRARLNTASEIKKIIHDLRIPIDGLNFMPGGNQAELRYKNKTIGYVMCRDEGNQMFYQTQDALTQKHLDWHFIFQHNKSAIVGKISEAFNRTPLSVIPGKFRQMTINFTGETLLLEARYNGTEWEIFQESSV